MEHKVAVSIYGTGVWVLFDKNFLGLLYRCVSSTIAQDMALVILFNEGQGE